MIKTLKNTWRFFLSTGLLIPIAAHAQTAQVTALGEVNNFGELTSLIWAYGAQVIIVLAILFIVLGAVFYVASAGNEEKISQGKQMVIGAIVAIFIVLLSGVLIRVLHAPLEGSTGVLTDIPKVIHNATNILIGLIGGFSILMLTYAGVMYITGRGDADKVEKAHNAFRYAIYGLVIGTLAYGLVNTLINFLI